MVPWEGHGDEVGPRPSQGVMSVGEDQAEYEGGRRQGADKRHIATTGARGEQLPRQEGQDLPAVLLYHSSLP